jgi:hypothetical protein
MSPWLTDLFIKFYTDSDPSLSDPIAKRVQITHYPSGTSIKEYYHMI